MNEILSLADKLYDDILKDNMDSHITHLKDFFSTILYIKEDIKLNDKAYCILLELCNLCAIYDIQDNILNQILFNIRMWLIDYKKYKKINKSPYSDEMYKKIQSMGLV